MRCESAASWDAEKELGRLRVENAKLKADLEYEKHSKETFAALCESLHQMFDSALERKAALRKELDGLQFAAHMPDDYQYGLPSWICQRLYMAYITQAADAGEFKALQRALDERDALTARCEQLAAALEHYGDTIN